MTGCVGWNLKNGLEMRIVIDFSDALREYADALFVDPNDTDSMWYVADIFETIVCAALDSNKTYKDSIDGVVAKIAYETGESRAVSQSACDLAITQVLAKMDEHFVGVRHVDLYKTRKDIKRFNLATYIIDVNNVGYI